MSRAVIVQMVMFVVTAILAVTAGSWYVLGPQSLGGAIHVNAHMSNALGLGVGSAVTYRGMQVGKIENVSVAPGGDGADLRIALDPGTRIPVGSPAKVTTTTALGIQTLDITPDTEASPYLEAGGSLVVRDEDQPAELGDLLVRMSDLIETVDPGSISTLSGTFGTGLDGAGPELQQLIENAGQLSDMLSERAPALARLVENGVPLLETLADNSDSIPGVAGAFRDVSQQLVANEPSLVYLMDRSPEALERAQQLFDDNQASVGGLLTNLVTVGGVLDDRQPALAAGLESIPDALDSLGSVVHGDRADFTLVGTQGPVCYYDTPRRVVGDVSPRDPNLALYCPPGDDLEQRGSRNAPRPDALGLGGATEPGHRTGPPMVDDPVLIPTGVQALDYWKQLLEGIRHGSFE
ncbi:MlaD family protein [Rhodococcus sp. NPDC058521]|uniref:MlaD family protein n=1 Tax=Rhodococcus sp. NPDC058521 TaxID=3346536 RepID=UPI0036507232